MATFCPCGCATKVGFTRKGAAKGFVRVEEMIPMFRAYAALTAASPISEPIDIAKSKEFCERLAELRADLRAHLHGTARPYVNEDLLGIAHTIRQLEEGVPLLTAALHEAGYRRLPSGQWLPPR